jgi:hypothetical protein
LPLVTGEEHMNLQRQILDLEEQFWRGGADVYRSNLAADALMVFGPAGVLDRDAIVAGIEGGQRWDDVAIADVRVVELTGDVCLVTYRADARRGADETYAALVSSVYVRRDDAWRLAFHQHTAGGS